MSKYAWWHDEFVDSMRLDDGNFPLYKHQLGSTIHGEQYMAPWQMHRRIDGYVVDDFGNWHCRASGTLSDATGGQFLMSPEIRLKSRH